MIDALVGSIVALAATTAMFFAVQITQTAFSEAGKYPLLPGEIKLLEHAGYEASVGSKAREDLSSFLENLPSQ